MEDQEHVSLPPEDRLAAEMADPSGAPRPVSAGDPVLGAITAAGIVVVAVGGLMVALLAPVGHTAGATRSAKLQWEYRQRQIEQAVHEECAGQSPSATPPRQEGAGA